MEGFTYAPFAVKLRVMTTYFANGNIGQVWRLDPEVRHINGAGCCARYRITHNLPLHVKDLFVGFAVHRQIAG